MPFFTHTLHPLSVAATGASNSPILAQWLSSKRTKDSHHKFSQNTCTLVYCGIWLLYNDNPRDFSPLFLLNHIFTVKPYHAYSWSKIVDEAILERESKYIMGKGFCLLPQIRYKNNRDLILNIIMTTIINGKYKFFIQCLLASTQKGVKHCFPIYIVNSQIRYNI